MLHERGELFAELFRVGDDVDRPEQRGGDAAQFADIPVGAEAATVTLESADALRDRVVEFPRLLMLVLAIGEQDRVADRGLVFGRELRRELQPRADRGAAVRFDAFDEVSGLGACGVVGGGESVTRVDEVGVFTAADDGERDAVTNAIDRGHGCGAGGRHLAPALFVHRSRDVDDDDLVGVAAGNRGGGPTDAHRDDGIDDIGVRSQEFVLEDLGGEGCHCVASCWWCRSTGWRSRR